MILDLLSQNQNRSLSNPQVFKFRTNAQNFRINFKITDTIHGNYPHVGLSLQEGIMVLYKKEEDICWLNVDAFTERYNRQIYMHHLVKENEEYEVLIYGPVLSKLSVLKIEIPEGNTGSIITNDSELNILVAGGLISYGIGCTTASLTFSSMLGRKLEASVDQLTYNNANYLEKINEYFEKEPKLRKYDVGILEADYVNQNDEITKKYLRKTIENMQKYCKTVICWYCLPKYKSSKKEAIHRLLDEISSNKVFIEDFSFLFDKKYNDICTYSGNFINDSGNMMIYKELEEIILEKCLFFDMMGDF